MKKTYVMLAIGVLAGFVFGRYWPQEHVAVNEETSVSEDTASSEASAETSDESMELVNDVKSTGPLSASGPIHGFVASVEESSGKKDSDRDSSAASADPEKLNISFSDALIDKMEDQWDDLPNQVRLQRESRGYRVVFLQSGSVFSQTGLRKGDLITRESLEDLLNSQNGNQDLTARVTQILGHVSSF